MPVHEHLEELRWRILYSLIAVILGFVVAWPLTGSVLAWLKKPLGSELYFFSPAEAFWTHIKVALVLGLILAVPVVMYHAWRFVMPGLYRRERRYALLFSTFSLFSFVLGVVFCAYVALPFALRFLIGFGVEHGMNPLLSVGRSMDFILKFYLSFGLIFQLPLVLTLLARLGVLDPDWLARQRRYAILANAIVAAILTPTSDIFNMMLMLIPLTLLYELGILGARLFGTHRRWVTSKAERHAGTA